VITYFQAIVLGFLQGVTELFPISSLGHSVAFAWLFNWDSVLKSQTQSESFFLSFLVALHVATGTALLIYYRETWTRIIRGFFGSIKNRKIEGSDSKLAWLLIAATIPAGLFGLIFEHHLRTQFAKPLSAVFFLFINGCILIIGDNYQKRGGGQAITQHTTRHNVSGTLTPRRAAIIGTAQIGALFAGISRSGITMVSGLYSGLNHEDAARFSFLLATPIIFGAGIYKLPDFFSNLDAGMRGQILAGSIVAGIAAYMSVRYLDKYFRDKTLRPFGIYCIIASLGLMLVGLVRGHF
jgi:undecaprenyl-diphosphatase